MRSSASSRRIPASPSNRPERPDPAWPAVVAWVVPSDDVLLDQPARWWRMDRPFGPKEVVLVDEPPRTCRGQGAAVEARLPRMIALR